MKIARISLGLSNPDRSKHICLEADLNGESLTDAARYLNDLVWAYLNDQVVPESLAPETGGDVPDLTAISYHASVNGKSVGLTAELEPGDELEAVFAEIKQKAEAIAASPN